MMEFLVDNSSLQARSPGLGYRFTKKLEDKDKLSLAKWGSVVKGEDEGDGWLKVIHAQGTRYLPFQANGVVVLRPTSATPQAAKPPRPQSPLPQRAVAPHRLGETSPGPGGSPGRSPAGSAVGYVFICGNETMQECASLGLVGAAQFELAKLKRYVSSDTRILLFNFETFSLIGTFTAAAGPERDLVPGAFGGKLSVHIKLAPLEVPLRSVKLEKRVVAGPKGQVEFEALASQLAGGSELDAEAQASWKTIKVASEPPAKRRRGSPDKVLGASPAKAPSPLVDAAGREPKAASPPAVASTPPKAKAAAGVDSSVAAGYVFLCANRTFQECQDRCLFGSPQWELPKMKRSIAPSTQLFLYNFDSQMLVGPFLPVSAPDKDLQPGAFAGKFSAQVVVKPAKDAVRTVKMLARVAGGHKSADEVAGLTTKLGEGEALPADVQEAWAAAKPKEPPKKRAKTEAAKAAVPTPVPVHPAGAVPKATTQAPVQEVHPAGAKPKALAQALAPKAPEAAPEKPVAAPKAPISKEPSAAAAPSPPAAATVPPTSTKEAAFKPPTPKVQAPKLLPTTKSPAKAPVVSLPKTAATLEPALPKASLGMLPMPGYVFMCASATYRECEKHRILGSPPKELFQMKKHIDPTTQLFLFNFDSSMLLGPLMPMGEPEKDLVPGLFGGRFQAHVRVAACEVPLREARLDRRPMAGAKSKAEVDSMLNLLEKGRAVSAKVQEAWGVVADADISAPEACEELPNATPALDVVDVEAEDVSPAAPQKQVQVQADSGRSLQLNPGVLGMLGAEARGDLEADLAMLADTFGIGAVLESSAGEDRVELTGDETAVAKAMEELQGVLQFYGVAPLQS